MWHIFVKGGPVMFLLLLCSIWGLFIIVQKYLYIKANQVDLKYLVDRVKSQIRASGVDVVVSDLNNRQGLVYKVLANVLQFSHLPAPEVQEHVKEVTRKEVPNLERNLGFLSVIITVAPILGLMGTVLGLMDIFNVISGGNIGDAAALSSGIAKALITTVAGLGIAIPFIFLHHWISHKIDQYLLEIEVVGNDILRFSKAAFGRKS